MVIGLLDGLLRIDTHNKITKTCLKIQKGIRHFCRMFVDRDSIPERRDGQIRKHQSIRHMLRNSRFVMYLQIISNYWLILLRKFRKIYSCISHIEILKSVFASSLSCLSPTEDGTDLIKAFLRLIRIGFSN